MPLLVATFCCCGCWSSAMSSALGLVFKESISRLNASSWLCTSGPIILAVSRLDSTLSTTCLTLLSMQTTSTSHSPCFNLILTSSAGGLLILLKYTSQIAIDKSVAGHIDHVAQY